MSEALGAWPARTASLAVEEAVQLSRARIQLEREADQCKSCFDRTAQDLPLADGDRVYRRKRGILGRIKTQDAWNDTVYGVVSRQGTNERTMCM